MTEKTFLSKDGKSNIHYYVWEPEGEPKAILQIVHGMAEHMERYAPFAEYLNGFGVLVCGEDHIGHGKSSAPKDWGYMGEDNGWKIMVQDVEQLHQIITVQYMDVPYFILGHSMGSFITRAWLAKFGTGIDGAVIMGTAGTNPVLGVAKTMVSAVRKFKGSRHISKTITKAAFGSYNKRIPGNRTPYDWLTRDDKIVDKYIDDPACGFTFTAAGYADLFNIIGYVSSDDWYGLVPKDLPILLVSGSEDPVGNYGEGPAEVAEKLQEIGCTDVSLILYEDMRHEILNEIGKETVMDDIRRFIFGEEAPEAEGGEDEEEPEVPEEPVTEVVAEAAAEAESAAETAVGEVVEEAAETAEHYGHFEEVPAPEAIPHEEVFEAAAEKVAEKIDMTAEEAEAVAHKGVRNLQNEFDSVEEAGEKLKNAFSEAVANMDEEVHYGEYYAEAEAKNVNEKVLEKVESFHEDAKSVVEAEPKAEDVPHKGIRNIEQTLWEHEDK